MSIVKLLFKFIILVILFIVFALYYYTRKSKDGFQNRKDTDYHYPHFDISANYYELTQSERATMKNVDPDSIMLDIGNTFGENIDRTTIPWDSELRFLKPSQVLWGVISREASANLHHKIYEAQQIAKAKAAEDGEFYFDSALLHYGTSDPNLGNAIKVADFIANFTGPLVVPMIGEKLGGMDPLFEWEVYQAEVPKQGRYAQTIPDAVMSATTQKKQVTPNMKLKHSRISDVLGDGKNKTPVTPTTPKVNSIDTVLVEKTRLLKINSHRTLGKLISFYFDALELIPPPVGPILNAIYMVVIMPIVMAIALPLTAPKKGSNAIVEIQTGNVYASLASMAATALLSAAFPGNVLLSAATMAAALWGALAAFYQQQVAVPAGYKSGMEQMLQQTGHGSGDGKCPNGYVPLDQIWNPTTQMFLSFFPIIGDLIDLLYPYLCVRKDATATNDRGGVFSQLICIRDPYVIPKYMEQSWISSMFLEWPNYNNKLSTGTNIVGGKLRIVTNNVSIRENNIARGLMIAAGGGIISSAAVAAAAGTGAVDSIFPTIRTRPYWSWSGYTNFNDIKNNPNNYYNLNVKLENFERKMTYEFIGGRKKNSNDPDTSFRFFYLDFSDPNILIEMAQFYYNYAIRNPQIGDDRTFTIEYIAKINYITSSSVFSCDVMCEMISVQYDARTGKFIKEIRTYDSDRRFYFRWKPINDTGVEATSNYNGMPVTDIWGNDAGNEQWRQLDDMYDDAMYNLNDAIHFPTDPTEDPTGLIGGDVLLTGYELYLEKKERSDAAAAYIVATNPTFRYRIPAEVAENSVTAATLALSFATAEVTAASTASSAAAEASFTAGSASLAAEGSATATAAEKTAKASAAAAALRVSNAAVAKLTAAQAKQTLLSATVTAGVSVGKSLNELKLIYDTLLNSIISTTAQLAIDESVTQHVNATILNVARDNYEKALLRADPFYLDFKIVSDTAEQNYIDLLGKLYTTNEDEHIFFKNDLTFRHDIVDDLQSKMDAVIAAREALWIQHKKDESTEPNSNSIDINNLEYKYGNTKYIGTDNATTNPIRDRISNFMTTKYYDVTACTHIDGTGPAAITPDVTSLQSDIRFPSKFDVLPHLKRCENISIRLDKCIDLSNIEQVIQAVERQKPEIRIKTIHNIKARGNNTCQYIWDEYNNSTPDTVIRTTNRILYQQDISACTFCLPEAAISASDPTIVQKIYLDTSDNKKDEDANANITTSLGDLIVPESGINHYFQPLNNYKNTNGKVAFKRVNYNRPILPSGGGEPTDTEVITNQLYIPRYDVNNKGVKLPDLVRPKKPIRISYPNGPESSLGKTATTNLTNYCSDPVNMSNFMLRYNKTNSNNEMIINIQRAFTTTTTTCDYEIDVFIKDPIQKNIYDEPIMSGGNTIPLLQTDIIQIEKIDENGTKVKLTSVNGFSEGMNISVEYTINDKINPYTLTTKLIIGVTDLTPNIFNPYEKGLRTELLDSTKTAYVGANNTIIGFNLHNYKLIVDNNDSPTNLTCIVTVTLYNNVSRLTTKKVVKFSITSFTYSSGIISYGATDSTIDSNLGPSVTYTISSCSLHNDINVELNTLGDKTTVTIDTPSLYRVISINSATINSDAIASYDSVSTRRSVSQSIQGLRVIDEIDVSNNTITYINDEDKMPLDIDFYPTSDTIRANGTHTEPAIIRNIPASISANPIGKITLKNTVTRKTVSYDMTSSSPLTEPYQNTPSQTPFTYTSINAPGDGLQIKRTTPKLNTLYSNTGYNFAGPAKSNIDSIFGPNTNYYNDRLVTEYTTNVSNVSAKTSDFLRPLVQAIKLSNFQTPTGATSVDRCASQPLLNVCSNPTYMQRIMDSYNNANSPIGIYNQERNTMTKIIQASTADGNKCHLIFENKNERFNDITAYNSNDPNNYIVTNTLKFMSFPMISINTDTCDFIPQNISVISNNSLSTYLPIRASDLTLSYSDNFNPPYVKSLRNSICQVGHGILFNNLRDNYTNRVNVTGNPLSNKSVTRENGTTTTSVPEILAWRIVGYDKIDYLLSVDTSNIKKVILRGKFDLAPYIQPSNPSERPTCGWSYINNSFKVQISLLDSITGAVRGTYTSLTYVEIIDRDSATLDGTDNISPLIFHPEFNTP